MDWQLEPKYTLRYIETDVIKRTPKRVTVKFTNMEEAELQAKKCAEFALFSDITISTPNGSIISYKR